MKLEEVFKIGGSPTVTFVEPKEYAELLVALRTDGRSLVVEGPSGIGKTTSVLKAIVSLGLSSKVMQLSARKKEDIKIIGELPELGDVGIVMIDDFHKLSDKIKKGIADFMKILADEENTKSKIIVLGINHAGNSLIKFAHDLNNRITVIRFEANPEYKIVELIEKGEQALNIEVNVKSDIATSSVGSFYIAQMLAHQACIDSSVLESQAEKCETSVSFELVKGKVLDRLGRTFYDRTRTFAQGQRVRSEGRAPYLHLLHWLSFADGWTLSIAKVLTDYTSFKGSITQIVNNGYLEDLISKHDDISSVLHYDPASRQLTIEDPQYIYYLRNISWKKFAKDVGFSQLHFDSLYDFALSFSGSDRDIAEKLFTELTNYEFEVFYDKNEQHRIVAEDVEDYLRPIYMSDAEYVIVILGPDYPVKVWTKFESDNFKARLQNNEVIPVFVRGCRPDVFSPLSKMGFLSIVADKDFDTQIMQVAEICRKKLEEQRRAEAESEQ